MSIRHELRLTGGRVLVREFRRHDAGAVHAIISDEHVTRTLSFDPRTREQAEQLIANAMAGAGQCPRAEFYLAIALPEDDSVIGFVRLALGGVRAAKLGFALAARQWGRGYATDAASIMIEYGFGTLDLHRITAAVGPDNAASHATIARLGFIREGTLRDHVFTNGAWRDSVLYSLLAGDDRPARRHRASSARRASGAGDD